jgi:hypothetical protein
MGTLIQIAGALAVLLAFALAQLRVLDQRSYSYLVLNLVGASVLAVDAFIGREWGFFVLEGVWAVVSLGGLAARAARDVAGSPNAAGDSGEGSG